jgi:hypothetical protein
MKKTVIVWMAGALALLAQSAGQKTYVGVISDSMCGADHKHMNISPDDKCVRECVKSGSKYVLLVGGNTYVLSDQQTPGKFAARKVKVTGTLYEKTRILKVDSIQAAE